MSESPPLVSLTARYVFPVAGPPLAGGCVTIQGERIVAVGPHAPAGAIDLGDVAILPGLVNAHTHLEFSQLAAPLGAAGMPLPTWIRQVVGTRRAAHVDAAAAITHGVEQSLSAGTTTVGEIATSGWTDQSLAAVSLDLTAFYELIGLRAEIVDQRLADAAQFVADAAGATHWHAGISPHAPYTVHPELFVGLIRLAHTHRLPVAMHLAESREELQLLDDASGPFRSLLEDLGAWDPAAIPLGTRPLAYLQLLAEAPRALVIHGNYLQADELELLAVHEDRMSVVYCPRTHAYFGHERYPLGRMLRLGVAVAVGTDSRASNPDLSVLAELRHVAEQFPALDRATVLSLGTLAGARALGREEQCGTLEPGKLANLAIVSIDTATPADPHDLLFASARPVVGVYYRGARVIAGNS